MFRFSKKGHLFAPPCVKQRLPPSSNDFYLYSDTVSRSGMFCAIATAIDRCKTEGLVDVFQVVKAQRIQKPGLVRDVVSTGCRIPLKFICISELFLN